MLQNDFTFQGIDPCASHESALPFELHVLQGTQYINLKLLTWQLPFHSKLNCCFGYVNQRIKFEGRCEGFSFFSRGLPTLLYFRLSCRHPPVYGVVSNTIDCHQSENRQQWPIFLDLQLDDLLSRRNMIFTENKALWVTSEFSES